MTDKQREAHIAALIRERRACHIQGKTDRVNEIDRQLALCGYRAEAPVKRAEKRVERRVGQ